MPRYYVDIACKAYCTIAVQADSIEQAIELASKHEMNDKQPHTWDSVECAFMRDTDKDWRDARIKECWKNKDTLELCYTTLNCEYKPSTKALHLKPYEHYTENKSASLVPFGRYLLANDGSLYPICPKCGKHYIKINTNTEFPRKHHTELCEHCNKK